MGNITREIETIKRYQMEILHGKNIILKNITR